MKRNAIVLPTLLGLLLFLGPSGVYGLTFSLDQRYDGAAGIPANAAPWLNAAIEEAGANRVRLTLGSGGLAVGESVAAWHFNLDPALTLPFFSYISGPLAEITLGNDSLAAGSAGGFDIGFLFTEKFTADLTAVYEFFLPAGEGPLLPSSFDFTNAGGDYFSAAQIAGPVSAFAWIADAQGNGPGPAPIPEPASMLLMGMGLAGMAIVKKMRHARR